ncbi:MAG TPA: sulfatase-like hydrolase/transferase, partial [Tepidisphaeraceae bacterium]|nr:sulfatase-like hydrolase/transferase [Tepidisphaeraceae bacterium]
MNQSTFSRRTFLSGCAAVAGTALLPRISPAAPATPFQPNILFILADDLGMECLSSYGGTSYSTPNLDQLAKNGLRFTRCYSNPLCSPSRVALMTGQYNYRSYHGWGVFDPQKQRTFGHMLKDAGYATSLSGKWQFDNFEKHPNHVRDCGFDEYCAWTWHLGGKRTPRYSTPSLWQDGKLMQGIEDKYGPDIHNDFVIDFIRRNQAKPFLAYYPMSLVHGPFERTPDSKNAGRRRGPQFYPDMVAYMDKLLGKLFGVLDELKLRDKTLILFTGDNGTPRQITSKAGERTIPGGKGTMADTGSHVPLIAHWPGVTPAGKTCEDLINFTDFLPTLAEATSAKPLQDRPIDGRSFLPQIR